MLSDISNLIIEGVSTNVIMPEMKKKTRRGKKRRLEKFLDNVTSSQECSGCSFRKRRKEESYSPKAPHNSTQFLMDDYLATSNFTCDLVNNLDSSFEGDRSSGEFSPNSEDSHTTESRVTFSYHDEFDYEEMYDPDSRVSFYEKDFEEVYKELHAEDLAQRSKDELIGNIQEMEQRLLSYELAEKLHSNTVLDLQSELDFLVEENKRLKEKSFV